MKSKTSSKTRITIPKIAALPKTQRTATDFFSKDDPLGSYTGICENPHEKPVQDADDL